MTEVRAHEALWAMSMHPEGTVERWLIENESRVERGDAVLTLRIEDALHEIVAPVSGRLLAAVAENDIIEPGSVLARIVPAD